MSGRLATEVERDELRLGDDPQAVLIVQHVVYDGSDEPLEFAEAVHPPGRWTLEQEYPLTLVAAQRNPEEPVRPLLVQLAYTRALIVGHTTSQRRGGGGSGGHIADDAERR